jgi:hypothetical protein
MVVAIGTQKFITFYWVSSGIGRDGIELYVADKKATFPALI